jgi:hypothetical protein
MQCERNSIQYLSIKQKLSVYNGILKKTIREAKVNFYNEKFEEHKTNIRETWKTINTIICRNKNKPEGIKSILLDGELTKDTHNIANAFNHFFCQYRKITL